MCCVWSLRRGRGRVQEGLSKEMGVFGVSGGGGKGLFWHLPICNTDQKSERGETGAKGIGFRVLRHVWVQATERGDLVGDEEELERRSTLLRQANTAEPMEKNTCSMVPRGDHPGKEKKKKNTSWTYLMVT